MTWLLNQIQSEPVAFNAVVQSFLAMLCTFGLRLTPEQSGTILVFTQVVLSFFTRRAVTANINIGKIQ